jgi:hypothetical protein
MNRLFVTALSVSVLALACSKRTGSGSPPHDCSVDSASLARTARASLTSLGITSPNVDIPLEIRQRPIRLSGSKRLIVTASWGGPSNGAILLGDCSGAILGGELSGYALTMEPIVFGPERTLVKLRAITGTGSGWRQERVSLYEMQPQALAMVWSGVVAEHSYQAASVGAYEETGELTYLNVDSLVHVTTRFPVTMTEDGYWRRDVTHAEHKVETYYWNSERQKYEIRSPNR